MVRASRIAIASGLFLTTLGTGGASVAAQPDGAAFTVRVLASGTSQQFGPDDLVHLGSDVFVAWQNGVGSTGSPSATGNSDSTVVEYHPDGTVVDSWSLSGKVDGMGADPVGRRIIATVNEDGNSSLYTIAPAAPSAQVQQFQYSPSGTLPHGGGTDSVTVIGGHIFIAASAPTVSDGPALYEATLSGGSAALQPVFADDSAATVANTGAPDFGQPVTLALTDPDSTTRVPASSPRFAGDLLLDSQGDGEQIYVSGPASAQPSLSVLRLDNSVDDTAFVTDEAGTLYITDSADNEVFAVTGRFRPGTAFTSVTPADANNPVDAPNYLAELNLWTGQTTPAITSIQAKGLMFVGAEQDSQGDGLALQGGRGSQM